MKWNHFDENYLKENPEIFETILNTIMNKSNEINFSPELHLVKENKNKQTCINKQTQTNVAILGRIFRNNKSDFGRK